MNAYKESRDIFFFRVAAAQIGPGRLIFEVSRSHTIKTRLVELPWTSDQHVAEAATYTTHSKHKRRTSMPSAGFEPRDPSNQTASKLHLRPHGHRDRSAEV